jgi:threonine dehydrogenase-like Zn-dependent dehydrogenase
METASNHDNSNPYAFLIAKAQKISEDYQGLRSNITPQTVAVLGAGAMGMGIASVLAEKASINVNLYDIDVGQFKLAKDIPLITRNNRSIRSN